MMTSTGPDSDAQKKDCWDSTKADLMSSLPVTQEDLDRAESHKTNANQLFAQKKFKDAVQEYTLAISYNPLQPTYYGNRAFAYIKQELYGAALLDANEAIALDPAYVKAYYRRAVAQMALGKLKEALADFKSVVKVAPRDRDALLKLKDCEKEFRRLEFEKAIAFEEVSQSALDLLGNIDEIHVEDSYTGPHLDPTNGMTPEFATKLLDDLKAQKKLHKKYVYQMLRSAKDYFKAQPPVVDVVIPKDAKITVCGDVHGQYYDLVHIFEKNGLPSPSNMYLFNGDFVDRGSFSVECILLLLAFKLLYPDSVFLTRGNHETLSMNKVYGFEGEVKAKYSDLTFKFFTEVFDAVPLAHLIQDKIFVVHGGLFSRDNVTLEELRKIDRFQQPPNQGLMCEMLWSDPQPDLGRSPSKRGVGIQFGPDVTSNFCATNNLNCIIRSHEVKQGGYEIEHNGQCITIFSAPNYCDSVGNMGAYIQITPDLDMTYQTFSAVPHPPIRPMQYASSLYSQMM